MQFMKKLGGGLVCIAAMPVGFIVADQLAAKIAKNYKSYFEMTYSIGSLPKVGVTYKDLIEASGRTAIPGDTFGFYSREEANSDKDFELKTKYGEFVTITNTMDYQNIEVLCVTSDTVYVGPVCSE